MFNTTIKVQMNIYEKLMQFSLAAIFIMTIATNPYCSKRQLKIPAARRRRRHHLRQLEQMYHSHTLSSSIQEVNPELAFQPLKAGEVNLNVSRLPPSLLLSIKAQKVEIKRSGIFYR